MDSKTTQENLKSDKTEKSEKNQDTTQDRSQQRTYILKNISDAWYVANLWITANEKILLVLLNGLAILVAFLLLLLTQKQVRISEDTAKKQLRAYIAVTELYNTTPEPFNARDQDRLEAIFYIINNGQTPATNVRDSTYIEVRSKTAKIVMPKSVDQFKQFDISANARHEMKAQSIVVLSKEQIAGVESGDLKIFLWGIIAYKDIFDEIHLEKFCFEYDFEQKKFQSYSNYDRTR